jgi:hypothetical protein
LGRVAQLAPRESVIVYFECGDLDERVAALEAQGFIYDQEPRGSALALAYLRDPDDNVLCLYRAGESRRNPPWRLQGPT